MRRFYLTVLLLLAAPVHAETQGGGGWTCPDGWGETAAVDQGHAHALLGQCNQVYTAAGAVASYRSTPATHEEHRDSVVPSWTTFTITKSYPNGTECLTRPEQIDTWAETDTDPSTTSVVCSGGCRYENFGPVAPATYTNYAATGETCDVGPSTPEPDVCDGVCTAPDSDGDGIPDFEDEFPDDPDESSDSDGDGIGDNADFSPNDPTNGEDDPGEEDGDDEGDNQSSGGGTCAEPPTCDGDSIQCNQLYQQWQIRCSGARVSGSPEICAASYTCEGNPGQCVEIALLRKTACAVEGLEVGGGGGDGAAQELVDGLQGGPADQPGLDPMGVWNGATDEPDPDSAGFGLSRACPPPITVFGKTITNTAMCDLGAIIAALVMLMGMAHFVWAFTQ